MKMYLICVHLFMALYLGGGIILSLAHQFKTDWCAPLRDFSVPWKRISFLWVFLFLPFFFVENVFPWKEFHGHKGTYFQASFVIIRLALYAAGTFFASVLLARRPYVSLIFYFLIGNFLAFDWAMSLEGHWFSNMYGFLYLAIGVSASLSFFLFKRFEKASLKGRVDLTHLLITTTIVWLYFQFSQFIIMWMGNLPREVIWYLPRIEGIYFILMLGIFALKFLPLLGVAFFYELKTSPKVMKTISLLYLLGSAFEIFWMIYPGGHK